MDNFATNESSSRSKIFMIFILILLIVGGAAVGYYYYSQNQDSYNNNNNYTTPTTVPLATSSPTPTPIPSGQPGITINIMMFNETKYKANQTDYFTKVTRNTINPNVAQVAVEFAIAGPSDTEKSSGHKSLFGTGNTIQFTSNSNCGSDASVKIDADKAEVRFCKSVYITDSTLVPVAVGQIRETLKQFPEIKKVSVLDISGSCFTNANLTSDQCYE